MSSGVETRPSKSPSKSPKFVAVIDENLGQAQRKIRLADLARGLLALTALTFAYLLVAVVFDLATGGTSFVVTAIRVGLFGVFAIACALLGGWTLVRYLTRVNPYFAARRLEETIPDSKNSLINWLDLRDNAQIPPAIYQAVGLRAAKDVESADPELVVSTRETTRLGIAIGVLALGLGLLCLFVPHQFRSLLGRALMPFASAPVPPPTTITLLKPTNGDAVVAANQRVDILALIQGQIADAGTPEAPALHFRNDPTDVFQRVPLEENKDGWGVRLTPEQIRSGLTYKLTAGHVTTAEHRLTVRTQPFVSEFLVTYRYRAYRKVRPETVVFPNATSHEPSFLGHRGTEVDLTIRTNTAITKGYLEFDTPGKHWLEQGVRVAEDPKALRFRFPLERSGTVRVVFEAPGGERNLDRDPYEIRVLDDDAPSVTLVEPGKDMAAPANGTLLVVGKAYDDFGVTGLTLKVRVPGKKDPIAQPYRAGKSFQLKDGTYRLAIEYYDTLHLDRLQLPAGTVLEYWLEATDNCDYPKPNVGKSATYKLKLITPDTDPKSQKSQSEKAETQAKAGQKKQDDQGSQGNNEKDGNKTGNGPGDKGDGDQGNDNGGKKDGGQKDGDKGGKNGDGKSGDGKSGEGGSGNKGSSPNQDKAHEDQLKKDLAKTGEPLAKELDKEGQKNQSSDSNPKGNNPDNKSGESKNDNSKSQDNGKSDNSQSPDKKSGSSTEPKAGDGNSGGSEGTGNPKSDKGKDDPSKSPTESSNASGTDGGGGDKKKDDSGKAKEDKTKTGEKGNESANGSKTSGTEPDKSPPDSKDQASKTGTNGASGSQKSTNKKEGAEKADGPVGKDAQTEVAKTPSDKAKPAPADVKAPPGAKGKEKKEDSASGKPPEPTREEIDTLGKKLKQKAPDADKMAKDLVQRGLDMTNEDNRKALQNALQENGRDDDLAKLNKEETLPPPMPGDGSGNAKAPRPSKDGDQKAMAKGTGGGDKKSDKKGNEPAAGTGGGPGYEEKLKAIDPDEEFKRRLGNLQIDDIEALKKRITPEIQKKAGVSPAEWQQFLKNAADYKRLIERRRPAVRPDAETLTGGKSKIVGQGPRAVEASPDATRSSLEGAAPAPPPEFEEAQRAFTRGKRN